MKIKSIKRIRKYKKMVGCTREQASIAVEYKQLERINIQKASICPICKQHSLGLESSGDDYTCSSWIECSNCDFTDETDIYEALQHWYDFDEILALCNNPKEYGYSKKTWKESIKETTKRKRDELLKQSEK